LGEDSTEDSEPGEANFHTQRVVRKGGKGREEKSFRVVSHLRVLIEDSRHRGPTRSGERERKKGGSMRAGVSEKRGSTLNPKPGLRREDGFARYEKKPSARKT